MTEPQSGARDAGEPRGEALRRWDPERIGPYLVLGRLGAGAMGQVYLGRSAAGRLVAVKTIKVDLAEEAGFRTRFAQEVAAARRVGGFFTAAVVEADPEADLPWLATAYVPAPSLARLVKACGPLPVGTVRWLAAGCAEALESIHGVGLVHRDLKPSNVLVAPDGPRVIDFGVARAAERMGVSTSRGTVGTPAYMAPEQARDTHQASAASDVYALGATLLFAATGHPPYQGDTVMDVLARLATEEPDLSGLPGELTELIAACLQRVPRDRPTSSAMLAQLGQFTETRPGAALEHSYLPDAAMGLIAQYQRNPLLASGQPFQEDSGGDATSASYTELPASYQPKPRHQKSPRRPAAWRRWVKTHLAWVGWVSVGAALVVGGVILGASLSSSGSPPGSAGSALPPIPPAPHTVCGTFQAGPGPGLCMVKQSRGSADTAFAVQGNHFTPGSPVTFTVSEADPGEATLFTTTSPRHVTALPDGTFQVAFSQLYSHPLALGLVTITASGPGGDHASTEFMVIPSEPPPGGAPST
ncbi:MAG TPA: serine/threonine-protein kinase [Streptosporangiaceae bacterium]|nr:serine/threonine-protein kinase [Streptosporangiaceae bacterium]